MGNVSCWTYPADQTLLFFCSRARFWCINRDSSGELLAARNSIYKKNKKGVLPVVAKKSRLNKQLEKMVSMTMMMKNWMKANLTYGFLRLEPMILHQLHLIPLEVKPQKIIRSHKQARE